MTVTGPMSLFDTASCYRVATIGNINADIDGTAIGNREVLPSLAWTIPRSRDDLECTLKAVEVCDTVQIEHGTTQVGIPVSIIQFLLKDEYRPPCRRVRPFSRWKP